jgi:hypothetical protein
LRAALLLILCLAAALRWIEPALVEFKYDEAHITGMALDVARGGPLPLVSGGTTLGIQRGALDVYLFALALKLGAGHVEVAVWLLGALGVLAVALTYQIGRRAGGDRVGLLAALFMASNPWLVFYDRKLWAHIQVVFSALLLLLAWQVVVSARRRAAFWFPIVAALQVSAHVLALLQGLSWLAALCIAPRRWFRRETGFGFIAAGVVLAPYLCALTRQGGFHLSAAGAELTPGLGAAPALQEAARLLTGDGLHSLAGLARSQSAWWSATGDLLIPLAALLGLGLLRTLVAVIRPGGIGARLLLAWTAGPALILAFGPLQPPLQYWTALLPLPALYLVLGGDWLLAGLAAMLARGGLGVRMATALRWGATVVPALVLVTIWVGSYVALLRAVDGGSGLTTFGAPLKRWEEAVSAARDWAALSGTQEVRVAVDGVDPGYDGEAAAVAALIGNPPFARFVAPSSPPAILLAHDRPSLYLWAVAAPEVERQLDRLGEVVWAGDLADGHPAPRVYRLPPASAASLGFRAFDPPPTFDVGLALIGYALPANAVADQPFQLTLVWRVLDPPMSVRSRDMTAFNHILDSRGQGVAQADGMALLSRDWWPGDVLIQPYVMELPAGTYRWRTGIYSRADSGRAQLISGGDAVDLPLFEVK